VAEALDMCMQGSTKLAELFCHNNAIILIKRLASRDCAYSQRD